MYLKLSKKINYLQSGQDEQLHVSFVHLHFLQEQLHFIITNPPLLLNIM